MVKKSIFTVSLVSALLISFLIPYSAEARTFKIATILPDGTTWMKKLRQGAKDIQKQTDNRVKFKFFTGGVMGSDKSILKKMRIGQLHGGALTGGGLAQIYPDIQIYSLPFIFHTFAEVDFVRKTMDTMLRDGLRTKGMKILGISEGGFAYFMSLSPIRKVDDLIMQKNWLPEGDQISLAVYETVGISPIPLSLPDVYTGLQTGLINTIGSNPTSAIAFQWHTKLKYVTDIPLIYLVGTFVMDEKAFKKIKPEDQKIVTTVMDKVFKELDVLNRADNMKAREALMHSGLEFISLSNDEEQRWRQLAEKSIESLGKKGIYSDKMYGVLTSLLQEYRNKHR